MIGNYIKGIDQNGKECEGFILDKVRTLQTIQMKGDGIGQTHTMPFALDAYLVFNSTEQASVGGQSLHLVQPQFIHNIDVTQIVSV